MYTLIYDFDGTFKNPKGLKSSAVNTLKKFLNDKENRILILSEAPIEELISYTAPLNLNVDLSSTSSLSFYVNHKLHMNLVKKDDIMDINEKFKDYIYTSYGEGINKNYIYSYKERLAKIYPKEYQNEIIDLSYYIIAIEINHLDELKEYILNKNLYCDILGKDQYRGLIRLKKYSFNKIDAVNKYKKESPKNITIGFGDSISDLSFMDLCDVKVAMKDSDWGLKSKADYITKDDEFNDGAILILNDICQMK